MEDVIVVGAGLAGLAAAQVLRAAGLRLCIVEKSRGVGGRLSTRRVTTEAGEVRLDHGAQYFTCRSPEFRQIVEPLLATGEIAVWFDGAPTLMASGQIVPPGPGHREPRYVCPAGMTALARALAKDLAIALNTRATAVRRAGPGWTVETDSGQTIAGRAVLLTPPPEQSFALLGALAAAPELAPAHAVAFLPCLAVLAGYGEAETGELPVGLRWEGDPVVAWSAVDSSKRAAPAETTFVVHATPDYSREHFDSDPETTARRMLAHCQERLTQITGLQLATPNWLQLHRWRYAMPANPLSQAFVALPGPEPLVLAGCWCAGARVEGAYLSGLAAGREIARWLLPA